MSVAKKETNTLYRQKYFVDSSQVIRYRPGRAGPKPSGSSSVIRKDRGRVSTIRVPMNKPAPPPEAQIEVQIERKGTEVRGIRIVCPCGRHAEVELDYSSESSGAAKGAGSS